MFRTMLLSETLTSNKSEFESPVLALAVYKMELRAPPSMSLVIENTSLQKQLALVY